MFHERLKKKKPFDDNTSTGVEKMYEYNMYYN